MVKPQDSKYGNQPSPTKSARIPGKFPQRWSACSPALPFQVEALICDKSMAGSLYNNAFA
jgi:hypothetical protein